MDAPNTDMLALLAQGKMPKELAIVAVGGIFLTMIISSDEPGKTALIMMAACVAAWYLISQGVMA